MRGNRCGIYALENYREVMWKTNKRLPPRAQKTSMELKTIIEKMINSNAEDKVNIRSTDVCKVEARKKMKHQEISIYERKKFTSIQAEKLSCNQRTKIRFLYCNIKSQMVIEQHVQSIEGKNVA